MKVIFNQTKFYNINYKNNVPQETLPSRGVVQNLTKLQGVNNFDSISFGAKKIPKTEDHVAFLLKYAKSLKCAYSGKPMIPQKEMEDIFSKLDKRPTAKTALDLLQNYLPFMHDIEAIMFSILKDASLKTKRDFQDILQELLPEALISLRQKQIEAIKSADKYIEKMSPEIAEQVLLIRNSALEKIEDNTFGRQPPLEAIKKIHATGKDLRQVIKTYQSWYKIPNSTRDIDAFIVKYARKSHFDIAKRLISPSMATIEHIRPQKRSGKDILSQPINYIQRNILKRSKKDDSLNNIILVSKRFNSDRRSMPLDEYMMLNEDVNIEHHLQEYIDDTIRLVKNKKVDFSTVAWYPNAISTAIFEESNEYLRLDTSALRLTKAQLREIRYLDKLEQRFSVTQNSFAKIFKKN